MKTAVIWCLVALNVLLLAALIGRVTGSDAAVAQVAGGGRASDYLMIPGEVSGGSTAVVYILDTTNGVLGAMAYDDSRQRLDNMQAIDLNRIFEAAAQAAPAPGAGGAGGATGGRNTTGRPNR